MVDTPVFTLSEKDVPPEVTVNGDSNPLRCQEEGCLNEVTKPARGRTPRFCDEHRNVRSISSGPKLPNWAKAGMVHAALVKYFGTLSFVITMVNLEDGKIIASGADDVATALVNLGRVDKEWRKYLERIAAPGKYGELLVALGLGIILPMMINHNLVPQFLIPTTEVPNIRTEGRVS